jgi:hypothetical protein
MAGHDVFYKEQKENNQAVTIDKNSNPVLLSFVGIVQPTGWQGTTSTTKGKKRTIRLRRSTTTAIPERKSTTITCHCQEKAIINCVLLLLNWSESNLRKNGVENIPPRINLGLESRND